MSVFFWDRAVAEKRARSLGSVAKSVATRVKNFDWNDWVQAMLKLSTGYMDAGQGAIGRQVINLLHWCLAFVSFLHTDFSYGGLRGSSTEHHVS